MAICAYCKQKGKMTREHVIPNWFNEIDKSVDDEVFLEKAPRKFVKDATVKDVCSTCNNIHLSQLDAYGKELYNRFFSEFSYENENKVFEYNFDKLLKWLIKCSYNSARVHNTDLEILEQYCEYLISDRSIPDGIIAFCSLIAPSHINVKTETVSQARRSDNPDETFVPYWFRLGVFRVPDFYKDGYCFRTVIINSYAFFLALPKIDNLKNSNKRALLNAMTKSDRYGQRLTSSGIVSLNPPKTDALDAFSGHVFSNPLSYGVLDDGFSSFVKENGIDYVMYLITKDVIEDGNTDDIEIFFSKILSSREIALLYMQKIDFSISGYDDDPR